MTRVLVAYFSSTGNTKALAEAVVEGVPSVEGVECVVKTVSLTTGDILLAVRQVFILVLGLRISTMDQDD